MNHKFAKIFDVKHQNKDFQVLFLKQFNDEENRYEIQMMTHFQGNSLQFNVGVETERGRNAIFDALSLESACNLLKQFEETGIDFTEGQ